MKTDRWTKILLTVIALNLTFLSLSKLEIIPKAYADEPKPAAVYPNSPYGLVPVNADGSINVRLNALDEIDVNITGISTFDELDVNIEEVGGFMVGAGPLKVKVVD
ncbi:MAG: hypothetical protein AAFQ98_01910 [Bacteroidota bacterium]